MNHHNFTQILSKIFKIWRRYFTTEWNTKSYLLPKVIQFTELLEIHSKINTLGSQNSIIGQYNSISQQIIKIHKIQYFFYLQATGKPKNLHFGDGAFTTATRTFMVVDYANFGTGTRFVMQTNTRNGEYWLIWIWENIINIQFVIFVN